MERKSVRMYEWYKLSMDVLPMGILSVGAGGELDLLVGAFE